MAFLFSRWALTSESQGSKEERGTRMGLLLPTPLFSFANIHYSLRLLCSRMMRLVLM